MLNVKEIKQLLKKLKVIQIFDPDYLPAYILKEPADEIVTPLIFIYT